MCIVFCFGFRSHCKRLMTFDFWPWLTHIFWLFEHLVRLRSNAHWPTRTGGRCAVHDQRCPPVENLTQESLVWDGLGVVCFSVGSYTFINSWATVTALFKWWNIISYFHEDAKGKLWVWCRASCVRHFSWQDPIDIYISGFVCKLFSQESSDRYVDGDVQNLFISSDPKVVTRLMLPATGFWAQSWLISVQCVSHRITMSCSCLLQLGLGFSP